MSRREQAKAGRRSRIVAAAHDLISEAGVDALSMKQVAERAGVSLSTVYNLFASKEAVLTQVFVDTFVLYRELVFERASTDPFELLFDSVDIAAEFYEAEPAFYRSMVWLVGKESAVKLTIQQPRLEFYADMVQRTIDASLLRPETEPRLVAALISPLYSLAYQLWAAGTASIDEFCVRAKFGMLVALKAFARPEALPTFDALAQPLESWLVAQLGVSRARRGLAPRPRLRDARRDEAVAALAES